MLRTMGQSRAYFFIVRMCERHNRRTIADYILGLDPKKPRLKKLCVLYGVSTADAGTSDALKRRLIAELLSPVKDRAPYDLSKLSNVGPKSKEQ